VSAVFDGLAPEPVPEEAADDPPDGAPVDADDFAVPVLDKGTVVMPLGTAGLDTLPLLVPLALPLDAAEEVVLLLAAAAKLGGGVACEGSTNAPTPHGIAAPVLGCVAFAGGVVLPEGSAMAKRVVQKVFGEAGERNW
jgi:hypothetical protein